MKPHRPPQIQDLLGKIKECIENGKYVLTKHAMIRVDERKVSLKDVLYTLRHGYHEKQKTSYDEVFRTWKYSIRGKTLDGANIRVIVAFVEKMAILTVIRI